MKLQLVVLATLLVLVPAGCATPAAQPTVAQTPPPAPTSPPPPAPSPMPPSTPTTVPLAAVVMGAAERYNAGDLDGLMTYWADDAIFYVFGMPPTGSEIAKGKEQIRAVFEENIASHSRWEVEIDTVVGDIVNIRSKNWHDFTRQIGVAPLEANGVFVIKDGKIASHTWTLTGDSAVRLKTALVEAMVTEPGAEPEATAPAETPVSEVTVIISGGVCSYDGPLMLQPGEVQVTVDVEDQDRTGYAVTFLTLVPGKDFMDLMAATMGPGHPLWSRLLHYQEVGPGESQTYNITVTEGPVYAVCWSKPPEVPIGNVGPFTVSPVAEAAGSLAGPKSDIVVTFVNGICKYAGPETLPAGELTVTINAQDRDKEAYAAAWFNLAPGKGLSDLIKTQDSPSPPPWADMIALQEAPPGGSETYSLKVERGPLYLLCWSGSPDQSRGVGSKGPLEVGP
jgi:hypothetical protein